MFESLTLDEPASTVDRVADELRRAVFEGELESGTPLREHGLAESLGVGRSTVREALTILVAEGLATRAPNKGVAVATPEAASVRDVCAARWVLEGAGVRNWRSASAEARRAVHESLDAYISAVHSERATYRELNERHLAFHLSLVALTGSPRLVAMQEHLVLELKLSLAQVDRIRRNAHDQAEDHAALVRLLDADRIDDAEQFLEKHLSDAAHAICKALRLEQ
ncbi:GntR family transcriptional regulator [Nocardioides sp. NPDC127514]|jgi:DNA-binding GntR family transcriptional regulator|uniref:GntR family transcriptional regulator n=1 Tax=unclassified Nocardioides TaxID=2615069 RepID=UPI00135BFEF6